MATVTYKLDEIAKNNGKNGNPTWIIVKNVVYDVTAYLKKGDHPGGNDLIEEWAGKDATRAFDDAGHSGDAKSELKKYKIGEVDQEDVINKKAARANGKTVENGKPKVVTDYSERDERNCLSIITCGLIA